MTQRPEVTAPERHSLRPISIVIAIGRNVLGVINKDSHPENIVRDTTGQEFLPGREVHLLRNGNTTTNYDTIRGTIVRSPYFEGGTIRVGISGYDGRKRFPAILIKNTEGNYIKSSWVTI